MTNLKRWLAIWFCLTILLIAVMIMASWAGVGAGMLYVHSVGYGIPDIDVGSIMLDIVVVSCWLGPITGAIGCFVSFWVQTQFEYDIHANLLHVNLFKKTRKNQ